MCVTSMRQLAINFARLDINFIFEEFSFEISLILSLHAPCTRIGPYLALQPPYSSYRGKDWSQQLPFSAKLAE